MRRVRAPLVLNAAVLTAVAATQGTARAERAVDLAFRLELPGVVDAGEDGWAQIIGGGPVVRWGLAEAELTVAVGANGCGSVLASTGRAGIAPRVIDGRWDLRVPLLASAAFAHLDASACEYAGDDQLILLGGTLGLELVSPGGTSIRALGFASAAYKLDEDWRRGVGGGLALGFGFR